MLVVSIQNRSGRYQLWAYDGVGWWLMAERETAPWVWPVALAGAGSLDLLAFRDGDTGVTYETVRMTPRSASAPSYAATGSFTTALLDAGERDAHKSWRSIGAAFATPEDRGNIASADPITLALAWSIDGGSTWTTAATSTLSDPAERLHELTAELPSDTVVARYLQLRVTFSSVADWAPVLTGLWADYAVLDQPPRRRRWSFAILARDASIQRDGSVAALNGRAQITALWQSWENNQTLSFRDLDFDADPTERAVRIAAIEEQVSKPSDAANWGAAMVQLQLLEL